MTEPTIAFIGAGNMARSLIGGLLNNGWPAESLIATTPDEATRSEISTTFTIATEADNRLAALRADIVVLCVKPQIIAPVLTDLAPAIKPDTLVISVAAGIPMAQLQALAGEQLAIVRAMPNTPALLGCGATGLFANAGVSSQQKALAESIFAAVGMAHWVAQERQIDAVTALSGSGPAYYFLLMELMEKEAIRLGLDHHTARQLTLQTAMGAATMAMHSEEDVAELRRRITSPNGTTEQAIKTFQEQGLPELVAKAMDAAFNRSIELAAGQ